MINKKMESLLDLSNSAIHVMENVLENEDTTKADLERTMSEMITAFETVKVLLGGLKWI